MDYIQLGKNIKNARKKQYMTQEVLAETVNLSSVFISQIENGMRKPSLETVYNISKSLNVMVDELLNANEENFQIKENPELLLLLNNRSDNENRLIVDVARTILKNIKNDKIINK